MQSLQLANPHMLVVVGIPGSGKTFFASQFSDTFNLPYVDYGEYRRVTGNFDTGSELAGNTLAQIVKTKQSVVIEGRGATTEDRTEILKLAKRTGYSAMFVWVQTHPDTAEDRSVLAKVPTISQEDFDRQIEEFENFGAKEAYVVISGKHTYASQAKAVLRRMAAQRTQPARLSIPTPPRNHPGRDGLVR